MAADNARGDHAALWPGHFAGRDREYLHIEKLANLDQVPSPHGFTFAAFPLRIPRASASWVRAVAICP
jgi:cyclase